jgi:hypothetical protein
MKNTAALYSIIHEPVAQTVPEHRIIDRAFDSLSLAVQEYGRNMITHALILAIVVVVAIVSII